ncbi:hypothetical protein L2E82_48972 [Cichorium intybus]|uniref:Uncharacterized protein n=1 Tax=Cichorium intybus TaxID=13427 RepID=A0ACB8Z0E2_CICIN|nr:hypothetical protein L2E82_48972 [Cichorium intybus]
MNPSTYTISPANTLTLNITLNIASSSSSYYSLHTITIDMLTAGYSLPAQPDRQLPSSPTVFIHRHCLHLPPPSTLHHLPVDFDTTWHRDPTRSATPFYRHRLYLPPPSSTTPTVNTPPSSSQF